MKIVTGYQGKAHITSNDDQGRNQGIFGTDSYVTSVGQQFAATLVNANELDIADGEGVMQGVHFRIEPGEVDAAKLQNGTSGMKRIDLVVARYTKDSSTGIENVSLVVIKGTESSSTPAVPAYNSGEILKGKNTVDFPLYKVTYNGINVSSVDRMFTKLQTMAELQTAVNKLNTDLPAKSIKSFTVDSIAAGVTKTFQITLPTQSYIAIGACADWSDVLQCSVAVMDTKGIIRVYVHNISSNTYTNRTIYINASWV